MARRPDFQKNDVLSEKQLQQLQERLSLLSPQHVRDFYREAHRECCLQESRVPSPKAIQQLVQAWKQMRKLR
jgi:hypothetical protein